MGRKEEAPLHTHRGGRYQSRNKLLSFVKVFILLLYIVYILTCNASGSIVLVYIFKIFVGILWVTQLTRLSSLYTCLQP